MNFQKSNGPNETNTFNFLEPNRIEYCAKHRNSVHIALQNAKKNNTFNDFELEVQSSVFDVSSSEFEYELSGSQR